MPKAEVASWFKQTAAVGRSPQPLPQAIIRDPESLSSVLGDLLVQRSFQKPFINVSSFGIPVASPQARDSRVVSEVPRDRETMLKRTNMVQEGLSIKYRQ